MIITQDKRCVALTREERYRIDPSLRCELAPVTRFRTKARGLFCLSLPFQSTLSTWHLTFNNTDTARPVPICIPYMGIQNV
jgi:hypothetical protein